MSEEVLNHVVVEPQAGDPATAPWILICHGLGDSHRGWLGVVPYLQLPTCGFVLVDAPIPYYDGFSWFRIPGLTGPTDSPQDFVADFSASRQRLAAFIDQLAERRGLSADRLILLGFSQGCQMVVAHGLRSQQVYRGIIGISGRFGDLPDYPQALGPVAGQQDFLITHGSADPLLPLAQTREQVAYLRDTYGLRMDWREYAKEHSIDPQDEIPEIRQWIQQRL